MVLVFLPKDIMLTKTMTVLRTRPFEDSYIKAILD